MVYGISIHAPARGATDSRLYEHWVEPFQSTHPHGVRRTRMSQLMRLRNFNPRTRTGCDQEELRYFCIVSLFQSTHPHGVRPVMCSMTAVRYDFNPRTRTGCDAVEIIRISGCSRISIHAPARGATQSYEQIQKQLQHFNPRTRTGCDARVVAPRTRVSVISIHAPARGAT